jgi:hypothetical protein
MYDIGDNAAAIYRTLEDKSVRGVTTARRLAVETWFKKEKLITVTKFDKVLPNFSLKMSHY